MRPETYVSGGQSRAMLEEILGKKALQAEQPDLDDARQWDRIGWNNRLASPEYYLRCAGIEAPTDEQLESVAEIIDRFEREVLGALRSDFSWRLDSFSDTKIERGEWAPVQRRPSKRPGRPGPIMNPLYNGSWVLYQTRPEFEDTIIIQVFPGESVEVDATFDDLQAGYDAFYWELREYLKDTH